MIYIIALGLLAVVGCVAATIAFYLVAYRNSLSLVEAWAQENDLTITSRSYRLFFKGPFFFNSMNTHTVFKMHVIDASGESSVCWICCGDQYLGDDSIQEVIWVPDKTRGARRRA